MPDFFLSIIVKFPDMIDGFATEEWRTHDFVQRAKEEEEWLPRAQKFLLMIADREACKEGWVYLVAVDHKGQVLPTRCRVRASKAENEAVQWYGEGVPLSESSADEANEIVYEHDGSGWDDW